MKIITSSRSNSRGPSSSRFESAKALALTLAESSNELSEPELVAWIDRIAGTTSPILEGCSGPNGWREYGVSHGWRLEVDVDEDLSFIFTESSPTSHMHTLALDLTGTNLIVRGMSCFANPMERTASCWMN